jgi:isopropylmalate/homocitrate/citramalate synthase
MFSRCWCRAKRCDLEAAGQSGVKRVHIALPVSDLQIGILGKSRAWVFDQLWQLIGYAKYGLLADVRSFEPFSGEEVGCLGTELVLGKHSGAAMV